MAGVPFVVVCNTLSSGESDKAIKEDKVISNRVFNHVMAKNKGVIKTPLHHTRILAESHLSLTLFSVNWFN